MLDKSVRKNEQLHKQLFNLECFKNDDLSIAFYTGFPNYDTLKAIFNYLNPGENGENVNYWLSSTKSANAMIHYEELSCNKTNCCRSLKPVDEFFLVLCKLRQGLAETHLAHLFNISQPTVSRIFITWINFMYLKFGQMNIWPSRASVNSTMPEDFKKEYGSTLVIIDCTKVRCEMPSSLHLNGEFFSSYKHHTTLKGLIGITPGGAISFISQVYTGNISDREIVIRSGLLELPFDKSDSVMADKGFTIEDLLMLGVYLNIPLFLGKSAQMPADQVVLTQKIASLQIHVECAINKIKNFYIWDGVLPLNLFGLANQIWPFMYFYVMLNLVLYLRKSIIVFSSCKPGYTTSFVITEDLQKMFVRTITVLNMYTEIFHPDICSKFFKTKNSYCDPTLNIDSVNQSS